MAKTLRRKRNGECIYCGTPGKVTDEHVFPEAWYPEDTPLELWKWQVPACSACNARYGEKESRILPFLAMSVEPWQLGAKGIADKAWKAMNARYARDEDDAGKRAHVLELMRRRLDSAPLSKVIDALPLGWPPEVRDYTTTHVRFSDTWPVFGKIIRGLTYIISNGKRIDENYVVRIFRELSIVPAVFRLTPATMYSCGPGIVVQMINIDPFPMSFSEVVIWQTHRYFAVVMPRPMEEELEGQGDDQTAG